MRVIRGAEKMQALGRQWRGARKKVALVPTMGFLHAGHENLMREARRQAGKAGCTVVSIYVNPTQFSATEDLSTYPRDLAGDLSKCRRAGVDFVFVPDNEEMYPSKGGAFSTFVTETILSQRMEGASRPTHFRGVTTVVAKLFNLILPTTAVFGAKDFQQAAVLKKMARDLNMAVKLEVAPTVREADGLAMSSRNVYLTEAQRKQAPALFHALGMARKKVRGAAQPVSAVKLHREVQRLLERQSEARVDYIEFFEPENLQPVRQLLPGHHMALAVHFGKTRLIDNGPL